MINKRWIKTKLEDEHFIARLKLTGIYFGVICFIILLFSVIVLQIQNSQLDAVAERFVYRNPFAFEDTDPQAEVDTLTQEAKNENIQHILSLDIPLLLLSAIISYILAEQVLAPITLSYQRQKRFIADASHEFKTPLTVIKSEVEELAASKETDLAVYGQVLASITEEVDRMTSLTNTLLSIAKSDHKASMQVVDVELTSLIHTVLKRMKPLALKSSIDLAYTQTSPMHIKADALRIEELISILIDNAIKYNKPGGKVEVKTKQTSENTMLQVKDTGIGIAKENKTKVTNRFYRISEDRSIKGFGLGLSIAKQIAEDHGAKLAIDSEEHVGTTVTLTFPT